MNSNLGSTLGELEYRVRRLVVGLMVPVFGVLPMNVAAQGSTPKLISLIPVLELPKLSDTPAIIDGERADPLRYSVSFQLAVSPTKVCTWFLVSSRVLVTAAHCVANGTSITLDILGGAAHREKGGKSYLGKCDRPPLDLIARSVDWALCLLDVSFPLPAGNSIKVTGYEVLNIDPNKVKVGSEIEITGFGCTKKGEPVSSVYMVGTVVVDTIPPNTNIQGSTVDSSNLIEVSSQPSILCAGDSGGPAFVSADPGTNNLRTVVGVNSQTINQDGLALGYLSSSSTEDTSTWIRSWADGKGQRICGIHSDARNCRPTE